MELRSDWARIRFMPMRYSASSRCDFMFLIAVGEGLAWRNGREKHPKPVQTPPIFPALFVALGYLSFPTQRPKPSSFSAHEKPRQPHERETETTPKHTRTSPTGGREINLTGSKRRSSTATALRTAPGTGAPRGMTQSGRSCLDPPSSG